MAVKVLIKRRFRDDNFNQISRVLIKFRSEAMTQDGYISSETMWDYNDPKRVVVGSTWRSIEKWNNWKESGSRKALIAEIEGLIEGPVEYEIFNLGYYPEE
jgi:heme-degrading monooxygenase HmoA